MRVIVWQPILGIPPSLSPLSLCINFSKDNTIIITTFVIIICYRRNMLHHRLQVRPLYRPLAGDTACGLEDAPGTLLLLDLCYKHARMDKP